MLILSIDAYDKFECIGGRCDDHCCRDWGIVIDDKSLNRYKKIEDIEFKEKFNKSIVKVRDVSGRYYNLIGLNDSRECVFLDKDKLCSVYKKLGPENMCDTCKSYPRNLVDINGVIQKTILLSCPEACRKLLLREEPIYFNIKEIDRHNDLDLQYVSKIGNNGCFSNDTFIELRSIAIDILQNRDYTIEERLLILGLMIEDIDGKNEKDLIDISNNYLLNMLNGCHKGITGTIDTSKLLDKEIGYAIKSFVTVISKFKNTKMIELIDKMKKGLKLEDGVDFDKFKKNYIHIKKDYYNPFISNYDYVFENYLVVYVFKHMMMYKKENLFGQYAEMLIYYSMIKFKLIGISGELKKEMDEEHLILSISTFSRAIEHNKNTGNMLKELVEEFKFKNVAGVLPLIFA